MKKNVILGILAGLLAALLITQPSFFTSLTNSLSRLKSLIPVQKEKKEIEIFLSPTPEPPQKPDASLLKDVLIENLEIDGQKYNFRYGEIEMSGKSATESAPLSEETKNKIIQLVFFYQWVKEDPLFTAPDFDLEGFKKSVEILKYLEVEYNKLIKREEHFFPLAFLEKIPGVFAAEKDFFNKPSDKITQKLLVAYQETAMAYEKEANRFWQTIKKNQAKIPDTNYVSFDNTTTKAIMMADVEKLPKNAKLLLEEVEKRKKCLTVGQNCQRPALNFDPLQATEFIKENTNKPLPLSILFPFKNQSDLVSLKGPYLVSTSCFGWEENFNLKPQLFYLFEMTTHRLKETSFDSTSFLAIKLATDNFYRRVAGSGWDQDLKTDLSHIYQQEDNFYTCRDPRYQTELLTLDYFWQSFKNKRIFRQVNADQFPTKEAEFIQKVQRFEEKFFSTTPPSWTNLEILSSYYAFAYRILPTTKENQILKDDFLKRSLLINRRLGNFPSLIKKGANRFATLLIKEEALSGFTTKDNFFYAHVYLARNFWNFLYFPFSRSFWRYPENLEYLEKREVKTISENSAYLNYQMARNKFGKETVERMHQTAKEYAERGGLIF